MNLSHLGLAVTYQPRSRTFYETYFGFDPQTAQLYPDGPLIIRNGDGFDLALHAVERGSNVEAYWEPARA